MLRRAAVLAALAAQARAQDQCGCMPGSGWSVTTGRGCCKPGSNTQPGEIAGCQVARGNTDCTMNGVDACGCPVGTGWSVTTGVGCCKVGSNTALSEEASCQATRGNLNCDAPGAAPRRKRGGGTRRGL